MDSGRLEALSARPVHLDTVRALHQTVVSLRTALEISKNELKELREKYQQHSQTDYANVIEKLTLENHILRRRIIDSDYNNDQGPNVGQSINQNIKLEVTYSPRSQRDSERYSSDIVIKTATPDVISEEIKVQESVTASTEAEEEEQGQEQVREGDQFCSVNEFDETSTEPVQAEFNLTSDNSEVTSPEVETQIEDLPSEIIFSKEESSTNNDGSFKTKLELLSKFDVRIKVKTIKEGTVISSTTSDTDSSGEEKLKTSKKSKEKSTFAQEHREHFAQTAENIKVKSVSSENIKMAVPNEGEVKSKNDKFDVQVRITSEENLVVKEGIERSRRKDTLNLDVDDLSFRSLSEGDNSVFSEGGVTPVDPSGGGAEGESRQYDQEGSGNESEEVDDIELIFTTDESKDMSNLQEDLVSIRDTEPWGPSPTSATHSTPVLIKFHTLDPDFQPGGETTDNAENENQENSSLQSVLAETSLKMKRVSLPSDKEIRHVAFNGKGQEFPGRGILKSCDNKSESMLFKRSPNPSTRRLDSVDSLTCEYNRNLSLDNTKSSSFELGSSMDILQRDESVDNFHKHAHLGHRFSVFAETDISKCGISEDDLSSNLNVRRNTCPNPFQFRPTYRQPTYSRPLGPFKATATPSSGRRPILRDGGAPRRDSGAQTDVCALPPRWSSDGYLAHKVGFSVGLSQLPTLPQRSAAPPPPRRLAVPPARPPPAPPRSDHTRRQLLSDIGFTSMVPELSRSADPLWTLGQRASGNVSAEGTPGPSSTTKFFSRGSSYRSPCASIDRSGDWTPQTVFGTPGYVPSRSWRSSLPDVRGDDTDSLLEEATAFLRRSGEDLRMYQATAPTQSVRPVPAGQPYIPAEPRRLRLGHAVKLITPQGRVLVGRVRYVGLAGGSAADSGIMVGAVLPAAVGLPPNDGTHRGRRYFHAPPGHTALFVPFAKVVMAWAT